ncbi:hypothetical protein [Paenibacillus solani]|uniref:hypothetical protein n=1 Tax=Paenibacillus solani TaxID=1705565 RepID=UPI0013F4E022|nr:hypothetical protein [Paenibacillus solani]
MKLQYCTIDKQIAIEQQIKQELAPRHFQLVLEWEEIMNYRRTLILEWLYNA